MGFRRFPNQKSTRQTFFFEDPRISGPIFDSNGQSHYFLGGTDYSRHVDGQNDLFVRNVVYPLGLKDGRLQPLIINEATGKPKSSFFISPRPKKMPDGWRGVDAKNGLITQLDDGSIVVHTRFRIEASDDPVYKTLQEQYGDKVPTWKYSIQSYHFKNYEDFLAYDWDNALEDLLGQALNLKSSSASNRVTPKAKIILKDIELRDFIPASLRVAGKPLGLGNGARRIRLKRSGQRVYASFNKNSEQFFVGTVPTKLQQKGRFIIEENEVSYLAPDHQLGYFKDLDPNTNIERGVKRVYSGMMSLYDSSASNLKAIYTNLIQALKAHQIAGTGGVLDLNHAAYFMGGNLVKDPNDSTRYILRSYAGAGDAHSESFDFDLIILLAEMSPGSSQWRSGQVYLP